MHFFYNSEQDSLNLEQVVSFTRHDKGDVIVVTVSQGEGGPHTVTLHSSDAQRFLTYVRLHAV